MHVVGGPSFRGRSSGLRRCRAGAMYIFGVYGGWGVRKTGLDKNLKLGPRQNFGGSGRHTRFKPPEFLSRSPRGADPCKPGWGWTAMRHGARGLFLVTCTAKSTFEFFFGNKRCHHGNVRFWCMRHPPSGWTRPPIKWPNLPDISVAIMSPFI